MLKSTLTFFILSAITHLTAQVKTVTFSDFDELSVSTSISVELIPSTENKADISVTNGDIDDLIVKQSDDEIDFHFKSSMWGKKNNNRKAEITLYYTTGLESIELDAGANVYSDKLMETSSLTMDVNSGARLDLIVNADKISSDVNSGGRVELEGISNTLILDVSSGGHFDGADLESKTVEAVANSGGYAKVFASESIDARANSGGAIKYKGEPKTKNIKKDKYSGGSVKKM